MDSSTSNFTVIGRTQNIPPPVVSVSGGKEEEKKGE